MQQGEVPCGVYQTGAMENWGLITYRETDLLVNPTDSGVVDMRNVALTVAHEMAHLVRASHPLAVCVVVEEQSEQSAPDLGRGRPG
jgi:hypothetical protein